MTVSTRSSTRRKRNGNSLSKMTSDKSGKRKKRAPSKIVEENVNVDIEDEINDCCEVSVGFDTTAKIEKQKNEPQKLQVHNAEQQNDKNKTDEEKVAERNINEGIADSETSESNLFASELENVQGHGNYGASQLSVLDIGSKVHGTQELIEKQPIPTKDGFVVIENETKITVLKNMGDEKKEISINKPKFKVHDEEDDAKGIINLIKLFFYHKLDSKNQEVKKVGNIRKINERLRLLMYLSCKCIKPIKPHGFFHKVFQISSKTIFSNFADSDAFFNHESNDLLHQVNDDLIEILKQRQIKEKQRTGRNKLKTKDVFQEIDAVLISYKVLCNHEMIPEIEYVK